MNNKIKQKVKLRYKVTIDGQDYYVSLDGLELLQSPCRKYEATPVNRHEVAACIDWLTAVGRKTKTPAVDSYDLKHVIERRIGRYVSNGATIVAAYRCGYPMGQVDGFDCLIGISKRCCR